MFDEQLKYQIALGLIPGLGPVTAKNVISFTGSVEQVFKASERELKKIPGVGDYIASKIIENRNLIQRAEEEINFLEKHNITPYFFYDESYPFLLKQCYDAPIMLYAKGQIDFNKRKFISVVGTRNATAQGKENCNRIIKGLSETNQNPVIVSGLAYGIDICAHRAALKYGLDTIAVLAHGFERIYPSNHQKTANEIIQSGALLTEFISQSKFDRQNFLKRNRIISGLSEATIVVESAKKGGALVTADISNSYDREVFAIPGRLDDVYSEGTNWLIKTHKAFLLQSAEDIKYILNWDNTENKSEQKKLFIEFTDEEKKIANILSKQKQLVIDEICRDSDFAMSKVSSLLLEMEFKGAVRSLPGKIYELSGEIHV